MTRFLRLLALILIAPSLAQAGDRVALVIGVGQYENTAALANPERDATAVAAALEEAGFSVSLHLNVTQREFGGAMFAFQRALDGAEAAVFYFAGHGIQIDGSNYLLSADAVVDNPLLVDQDGIELSRIVKFMESQAKTSIAIIDACRDNPLANALIADAGLAGRSAGARRGLAPISRDFANSMVVFATAPGAIAYDGENGNSPFTEALLRHINTPDVEVSVMLKRVTNDVLEETDGEQRPEVITSMAQEFYFIHNEIRAAGDVVVVSPGSDEGAAANLLAVAQQMPAGESRDAGLALVIDRFPETAAAVMAQQVLDSSRVAVVAAPAEPAVTPEPVAQAATARPSAADKDEIFLSGMDLPPRLSDPVVVSNPAGTLDAPPAAIMPPPPFGTVYKFDAAATAATEELLPADTFDALPELKGARPRVRPEGLVPAASDAGQDEGTSR